MALQLIHRDFCQDDHNIFRLFKMTQSIARKVLHDTFCLGCKKDPARNLKTYLVEDLKTLTNTKYRSLFDKSSRDKIEADTVGDTYDVTMLAKAIAVACEDLAEPGDDKWKAESASHIEGLVITVKNFRNKVMHAENPVVSNSLMVRRTEELRVTLETLVELVGGKYGGDIQARKTEVNEAINAIRDAPLAQQEVQAYLNDNLYNELKNILCTEGSAALRSLYSSWSLLYPLPFNSDLKIDLDAVFTKTEMTGGGRTGNNTSLDYRDVISECLDSNKGIGIIEGPVGSGKTTYLNKIVSAWTKEEWDSFPGLSEFHLVLYIECRDKIFLNLNNLIQHLFPNIVSKFRNLEEMRRHLDGLSILFLVDGFDELNASSKVLVKEVLQSVITKKNVVLATGRQESVKDFRMLVTPGHVGPHRLVEGVHSNSRITLLLSYLDQMKNLNITTKTNRDLETFFSASPARLLEHFKYPLNLVFLVYLWAVDAAMTEDLTSATSLYHHILELCKEKAKEKLHQLYTLEEIEQKTDEFLTELFNVAIETLPQDEVILNQQSEIRMKAKCRSLGVSHQKFFSIFMSYRTAYQVMGREDKVMFAHKGWHEYYAARAATARLSACPFSPRTRFEEILLTSNISQEEKLRLLNEMRRSNVGDNNLPTSPSFQQWLLDMWQLDSGHIPFNKYFNTLKHVIGVLRLEEGADGELGQHSSEVVGMLRDLGVYKYEEWMEVVDESSCHPEVIAAVSRVIMKNKWLVKEGYITATRALLAHAQPQILEVFLFQDPEQLPGLRELLQSCRNSVELHLYDHYRNPASTASDPFVSLVLHSGGSLTSVAGCISGRLVGMLPSTVRKLCLAVEDDTQADTLVQPFSNLTHQLPNLQEMQLHLKTGVAAEKLVALPWYVREGQQEVRLKLHVSEVCNQDVNWLCAALAALHPPGGHLYCVNLRNSTITAEGWRGLVEGLVAAGVRGMQSLVVWSPNITHHQHQLLDPFTRHTTDGCVMYLHDSW